MFTSEYCHPSEPNPGIAVLVKYGFGVEVLDDSTECWGDEWVDEWTRKVLIRARITLEIDEAAPDPQGDFLDWVLSIVEPFGGDPLEAVLLIPRVWLRSKNGWHR
jgi:hypothetical protein